MVEVFGLFVTLLGFVIGSGTVISNAETFSERVIAMSVVVVGALAFFGLPRLVTHMCRRPGADCFSQVKTSRTERLRGDPSYLPRSLRGHREGAAACALESVNRPVGSAVRLARLVAPHLHPGWAHGSES